MKEMTKSYLQKIVAKTEDIAIHLLIEQAIPTPNSLTSNFPVQVKKADHSAKPPVEKSKKHYIPFVAFAFIVLLTSMCIFTLPVSAASYHSAHMRTATVAHGVHTASNSANHAEASQPLGLPWYCYFGPLSLISSNCRSAPECSFIGVFGLAFDPRCTQGGSGDGNPWSFPCSDTDDKGTVDPATIQADWLSGDPAIQLNTTSGKNGSTVYNFIPITNGDTTVPAGENSTGESGHFFMTFAPNTYDLPDVQNLLPLMEGLGFALLSPVIVLIGYQMLWASWTFRYASILQILPNLILSIVAIMASYPLIQMLINLENLATTAVLALHAHFPLPPTTIDGNKVPYILTGDKPDSLRAIIMPISRWGCQANNFMGLLESKFVTDALGAAIPFIGGLVKLAGTIKDGVELVEMLGPFIICVMSIGLFAQVLLRIVLLNYYILISPVVFACWALPGGVGQKVARMWFKGFFSLLFVQTIQVFVAVTLPLILPSLPSLPWDGTHVLEGIILQLPPIIVLAAVNKVPKLMGTKATAAMSQAGTVASGAVVALAGAAWSTV